MDLDYSPIRGPEGNIEYLAYIRKPLDALTPAEIVAQEDVVLENTPGNDVVLSKDIMTRIGEIVAKSHETL